jgi:hypothetical protein
MDTITVCLVGDDRARAYPVVYRGNAEINWDGEPCRLPVALVTVDDDTEAFIAEHPEHGWCSVHDRAVRELDPPTINDRRLNAAL